MTGKTLFDQRKLLIITKCSDMSNTYMAMQIKSLFTFGLHIGGKLLDLNERNKLIAKRK